MPGVGGGGGVGEADPSIGLSVSRKIQISDWQRKLKEAHHWAVSGRPELGKPDTSPFLPLTPTADNCKEAVLVFFISGSNLYK